MKRFFRRLLKRQQKGQSVVILALGMVALLGFVGITTDVSLLFVRYATLRRAVDAAAIAAAGQMRQDRSVATVSLTARSYIEFHGLNPRDVWVESCHNQPRPDFDPSTPGLQNAPPQIVAGSTNYRGAYDDLAAAIAGGTTDLVALRNAYTSNASAYINALEDIAGTIPANVTPLRNAYTSALTTYSTYTTLIDLSNNLGLTDNAIRDYEQALYNILPTEYSDDKEICTDDKRKLVRVTAQIMSPTVFLRLFGWQDILLQASAISETAVLDVVIVMDVSESMMFDTTIKDWEAVHMAVAYLPPRLEPASASPDRTRAHNYSVLGQFIRDGIIPTSEAYAGGADIRMPDDPIAQPPVTDTYPYIAPPPRGNANFVNGYADTYESWIDGWFWGGYLLGVPQVEVNRRLYYLDVGQPIGGLPPMIDQSPIGPLAPYTAPNTPNEEFDAVRNEYYQVRSFIPSDVTNPADQSHPREACRVRFYPFSMVKNMDPAIAEMYVRDLGLTNSDWTNILNYTNQNLPNQPQWSGFVPTFNFYGCCNDPSFATVDRDGNFVDPITGTPFAPSPDNWANDGRFDDLICQPMKQARDATRLFLERIDFLRGDRVGFVTFDKSAYIIDPDGANGKPGFANLSHMIEDLPTALQVLNSFIGVRAEPNYYIWNEDGGGWTVGGVPQYAAGYNQNNEIIPVNYDCDRTECPPPPFDNFSAPVMNQDTIHPAYLNYPVAENCSIQNAELPSQYSRFATRNTGTATLDFRPSLYRIMNPPAYGDGAVNAWTNYANVYGLTTDQAYEKQGMCRGTNIGAALRVGNAALTDPRTTRRAGTVWIMILLSDGAAGASDPVRRNGFKIDQALPYEEVNRFDWRQRTNPDPTALNKTGEYGRGIQPDGTNVGRGGYGWLGVCPYGTPTNPGRLVAGDGSFPYCSDTNPFTRHFCLSLPGQSVGFPNYGPGFKPGASDIDYRDRAISAFYGETFPPSDWDPFDPATQTEGDYILQENIRLGNIFDVDLGNVDDSPCDPLYDVDDYARDWADYVAGVDEEQSGDAMLPTIFTIGFRLLFEDTPHPLNPSDPVSNWRTCEERHTFGTPAYDMCMCRINVEQCLGEELLRYIADAGDNFVIDNDIQQDWRDHGGFTTQVVLNKSVTDWGPKDPCEHPQVNWFDPSTTFEDLAPRRGGESCGNYYNAPSVTELQQVFDDIASRMFTRLAG